MVVQFVQFFLGELLLFQRLLVELEVVVQVDTGTCISFQMFGAPLCSHEVLILASIHILWQSL